MLTRFILSACACAVLAMSMSCQSVARFPQCNGERLEPPEECELFMNGTSEAEKPCRELGYPSGHRATCDSRNCTWDTNTCELATNNANKVNNTNNNLECDPIKPLLGCDVGEACYFEQNETSTRCEGEGASSENSACDHSHDCQPGLTCLWGVCTRMCDRNDLDACGDGFSCNNSGWPEMWGFCPLVDYPCDFIDGSGCPSEHAQQPEYREFCYLWIDDTRVSGVCLHAGTSLGACVGFAWNECLPGHVCHMENCVKLCDDSSHTCALGTCIMEFGDYGFCQ